MFSYNQLKGDAFKFVLQLFVNSECILPQDIKIMSFDDELKVEQTINEISDEVYSKFLRKMQADAYRCTSTCYERPDGNRERDQECERKCTAQVGRAFQIATHHLQEYQKSLATCFTGCADTVRFSPDAIAGGPMSPETEAQLAKCVSVCINSFISKRPIVFNKIRDNMKSI